jgi:hypothetical protein
MKRKLLRLHELGITNVLITNWRVRSVTPRLEVTSPILLTINGTTASPVIRPGSMNRGRPTRGLTVMLPVLRVLTVSALGPEAPHRTS